MSEEILWKDRKRHLGLPWSFTKYSITESRIFIETGLLNSKEENILMYRVRDISMTRTLGQKIFGVGTIHIYATDKTSPHTDLKNIRRCREVKELIHEYVEKAKLSRRMGTTELLSDDAIESCPD
jgi:uncharacterized membrane protein YdbT with pleckstrin-like domain